MIDSKLWLATVVKYDRMMNMRKSVFIFLLAFLLSATSAAAQGVSAPARSVVTPPARAVDADNSSAVPLAFSDHGITTERNFTENLMVFPIRLVRR